MQFFILLIGVLVFAFYQFHPEPIFFNQSEVNKLKNSKYQTEFAELEISFLASNEEKKTAVNALVNAIHKEDQVLIDAARTQVQQADEKSKQIKNQVKILMESNDPSGDTNDSNYIFLTFVTKQLPVGVVGILIAIIFLASMGSTASGLNSLASTTVVDFYKRIFRKEENEAGYLRASRMATVAWGIFCVVVAIYASKLGNLIEAVNILGSLFYGTILGIFLVAFYLKSVSGKAVFIAAIIAEIFIVVSWLTDLTAFLWLNVIGCLLVMGFSFILQKLLIRK